MRIGLISDTHNHVAHVQYVADYLRNTRIDVVLHAGDVTSPHVLEPFEGLDLWIAQGNMDQNARLSTTAAALFGGDRFAVMHDLDFAGCKIALLHGHDRALLHGLAYSKAYDYVIRGHTHVPLDRQINGTRVLNPGAVGNAGIRRGTFAILDLETGELDRVFIGLSK